MSLNQCETPAESEAPPVGAAQAQVWCLQTLVEGWGAGGGLNGLVSVRGMTAIPPEEAVPAWEALNNAIHHSNTTAQTPPS